MLSIKFINGQKYTIQTITARALRRMVAYQTRYKVLQAQNDYEELLDSMAEFISETFNNQFTPDDVWDGLEAKQLTAEFERIMSELSAVFEGKKK